MLSTRKYCLLFLFCLLLNKEYTYPFFLFFFPQTKNRPRASLGGEASRAVVLFGGNMQRYGEIAPKPLARVPSLRNTYVSFHKIDLNQGNGKIGIFLRLMFGKLRFL